MILDLNRFLERERPYWEELEELLRAIDARRSDLDGVDEIRRFHYLFQRASADLAKLKSNAAEPALIRYLESVVGRAYAELHETRRRGEIKVNPLRWVLRTFPRTFRRQGWAFQLSVLLTLVGCLLGAALMGFDEKARYVIFPGQFSHLHGDPSERVAEEESETGRIAGMEGRFSASLMQNNIRVSINALALGFAWGLGTAMLLFYNGVILGAVSFDYVQAGETEFLLGWLLPHGSIEIPAILLAGQAGLVLGRAVIGWGTRQGLHTRLREIAPDIITLMVGVALMLIWAGFIESYFSQRHEPELPYWIKIAFGTAELVFLFVYLYTFGRSDEEDSDQSQSQASALTSLRKG